LAKVFLSPTRRRIVDDADVAAPLAGFFLASDGGTYSSCDEVSSSDSSSESANDVDTLQGCQIVSFQTKNTTMGKFWRALDWKMLIYFRAIWNILQTWFYDHLEHFFGVVIMYQEKSGNHGTVMAGMLLVGVKIVPQQIF
jgi:hypothetical protein